MILKRHYLQALITEYLSQYIFFPRLEGQTLQSAAAEQKKEAEGMGRKATLQGNTGQEHSLKRFVWLLLVGFLPPALRSEAP